MSVCLCLTWELVVLGIVTARTVDGPCLLSRPHCSHLQLIVLCFRSLGSWETHLWVPSRPGPNLPILSLGSCLQGGAWPQNCHLAEGSHNPYYHHCWALLGVTGSP